MINEEVARKVRDMVALKFEHAVLSGEDAWTHHYLLSSYLQLMILERLESLEGVDDISAVLDDAGVRVTLKDSDPIPSRISPLRLYNCSSILNQEDYE